MVQFARPKRDISQSNFYPSFGSVDYFSYINGQSYRDDFYIHSLPSYVSNYECELTELVCDNLGSGYFINYRISSISPMHEIGASGKGYGYGILLSDSSGIIFNHSGISPLNWSNYSVEIPNSSIVDRDCSSLKLKFTVDNFDNSGIDRGLAISWCEISGPERSGSILESTLDNIGLNSLSFNKTSPLLQYSRLDSDIFSTGFYLVEAPNGYDYGYIKSSGFSLYLGKFDTLEPPLSKIDHSILIRTGGLDGHLEYSPLTLSLYDDTSLIKATSLSVSGDWSDSYIVLTSGEAELISRYDKLKLHLSTESETPVGISFCELSIPKPTGARVSFNLSEIDSSISSSVLLSASSIISLDNVNIDSFLYTNPYGKINSILSSIIASGISNIFGDISGNLYQNIGRIVPRSYGFRSISSSLNVNLNSIVSNNSALLQSTIDSLSMFFFLSQEKTGEVDTILDDISYENESLTGSGFVFLDESVGINSILCDSKITTAKYAALSSNIFEYAIMDESGIFRVIEQIPDNIFLSSNYTYEYRWFSLEDIFNDQPKISITNINTISSTIHGNIRSISYAYNNLNDISFHSSGISEYILPPIGGSV